MDASVSGSDCVFHSKVGYRSVALALAQPGIPQVLTRSGTLVRLPGDAVPWVRSQQRLFADTFGPNVNGPLFFDRDKAEPVELSGDAIDEAVAELMAMFDLSEASRHAYTTTGLLPPARGASWPPGRLDELHAARAEWAAMNGVGAVELAASFASDAAKVELFSSAMTVSQARADPELAAELVSALDHDDSAGGEELLDLLDALAAGQRLEGEVLARAGEYARAWQGAELAGRVRAAAAASGRGAPVEDPAAALALLAALRGAQP
jgi:hypothetical protein